jgi:hypothetical protein
MSKPRTRAGSRTASPASGNRVGSSSSTDRRRIFYRIAANSLNADFDEVETSPASAGILHVRPEPMASATLAAAEKLQTALGQTSYADHFATFVPPSIMQEITLRMKAMKRLLEGHSKFKSGTTLKKINKLSLEEFLKLMRLIFGTEAADLSSAQRQILRAFQGKNLTFENYSEIKAVCLTTLQITETYALPTATQRNITHQLAKQMRADHPESHMYHDEAKAIIDAIMASDTALKSLDAFTEDVLTQLCDNKTMFTAAVERGIFRPHIPKKRLQLEPPDEELAEKC